MGQSPTFRGSSEPERLKGPCVLLRGHVLAVMTWYHCIL